MHSIVIGLPRARFGKGRWPFVDRAFIRAHSYSIPHPSYQSSSSSASSSHASRAAVGVTRDTHGHIARSVHAKESFRRTHPCP